MKLDTIDQRMEFVGDLIEQAFIFQGSLDFSDNDEDNDWGGASVVIDDLSAAETMMAAEKIFVLTIGRLREPRDVDPDMQEIFTNIFGAGFDNFIFEILLGRLNHAVNILDDWNFRTKRGVKFKEKFSKKIDALIDKYENSYTIFPKGNDKPKLKTAADRLEVVSDLLARAKKLEAIYQRDNEYRKYSDVMTLTAMAGKLEAVRNLIQSELFWEQALADTKKITGVDKDVREKFIAAISDKFYSFMRMVLIPQVETATFFFDNEFYDRRLRHFQKSFSKILSDLLDAYQKIARP